MNNAEVARKFVEGFTKARTFTNNIFVEGRAIYSYGKHFPIAFRLNDDIYLVNSEGYSITTAKHKSLVKNMIGRSQIIYLTTKELMYAIGKDIKDVKELMFDKLTEENIANEI